MLVFSSNTYLCHQNVTMPPPNIFEHLIDDSIIFVSESHYSLWGRYNWDVYVRDTENQLSTYSICNHFLEFPLPLRLLFLQDTWCTQQLCFLLRCIRLLDKAYNRLLGPVDIPIHRALQVQAKSLYYSNHPLTTYRVQCTTMKIWAIIMKDSFMFCLN